MGSFQTPAALNSRRQMPLPVTREIRRAALAHDEAGEPRDLIAIRYTGLFLTRWRGEVVTGTAHWRLGSTTRA